MKVKTNLKAGQVAGTVTVTQGNTSTVTVEQTNESTIGGGGMGMG